MDDLIDKLMSYAAFMMAAFVATVITLALLFVVLLIAAGIVVFINYAF